MEPRNQRSNLNTRTGLAWGGRPPLFDRLCGDPDQGSPRVYDVQEVYDSVAREVWAMLNTRLPVGSSPADNSGEETVVSYGLSDFSGLNPVSPADRLVLAHLIERKVSAFEPRLRNIAVSFEPDPENRVALIGTLAATLETDTIRLPVSFRLAHTKDGATLMESPPTQPDAKG